MIFLQLQAQPLSSTLFPYTTLFRSPCAQGRDETGDGPRPRPRRCLVMRPHRRAVGRVGIGPAVRAHHEDRKSTRLNSSHGYSSYAVFCLKKKKIRVNKTLSILFITK